MVLERKQECGYKKFRVSLRNATAGIKANKKHSV